MNRIETIAATLRGFGPSCPRHYEQWDEDGCLLDAAKAVDAALGDDEHERLVALAHELHAEGMAWTKRGTSTVGSIMRGVANRILRELGEKPLVYEAPPAGPDYPLVDPSYPAAGRVP